MTLTFLSDNPNVSIQFACDYPNFLFLSLQACTVDFGHHLQCYRCSKFSASSIQDVFQHCLAKHRECKFSCKRTILSEISGELMLRSIHFRRTPATVQNKLEQGNKCIFDTDAQKTSRQTDKPTLPKT